MKIAKLIVFISFFQTAWAGVENPNLFPLGDIEAYMGNAGVAYRGSSSSVHYNPAGLAWVKNGRFSASGTAYGIIEVQQENDFGIVNFDSFQTIPTTVVSVRKHKKWNLAYSVLVPFEFETQTIADISLNNGGALAKATLNSRTSETAFGISAARKSGRHWSWGVSLFAFRRAQVDTNSIQVEDTGGNLEGAITSHLEKTHTSVYAQLGIQNRVSRKLDWGLSLRLPNFKLSGKAQYYKDQVFTVTAPLTAPTRTRDNYETDADYRMPYDIVLGTQWHWGRSSLLLDLGFQGKASHRQAKVPDEDRTRLREKLRTHIGYRYRASEKGEFLAGAMWNPSAERPTENISPISYTGVTAGYYYRQKAVDTGAGVYYIIGHNDDRVFSAPESEDRIQVYGFLISGSVRF